MSTLFQDLRFGLRMLARNPGFTAVVVLTLTLGIGANTAIFSFVDGYFLRSLPIPNPGRLVRIWMKTPQGKAYISAADYQDLRTQCSTLSDILAYTRQSRFLNGMDETSQIGVDEVSLNYFDVLGIKALRGRTFTSEFNSASSGPSVVISYTLWRSRLGGDPGIVGKTVRLNKLPVVVLGVAPEHFRGLDRFVPTDAWLPGEELVDSVNYSRGFHNWESFGRMRPGATPDQVSAELDMIGRRLALAYPATNRAATFTGLTETQRIREDFPIYLLLMAAVGLVLLICCANVSGLILVQVESRRKEFAVRLAMGTTRARLIRQFLTEGLILSLSGSALGVMLAAWLVNSERALLPAYSIQIGPDLRIDGRVLAFTMLVTLVATLIFGVIPALHASKADITATLKGQEAGLSRGSRRVSSRNMMVIGQIALAILILSAAGLLIESLNVTMQVPVGFDVQKHLLIVNIAAHAEDEQSTTLLPKTSEAVEGLPGVLHATCAMRMPLTGEGGGNEQRVSIPGFELPRGQENIPVKFNTVSPSYFQTVGTRILKGRTFTGGDSASAPQVVVISATMARRFWPSHDPIGSSLRIEKKGYEIVGVVEDVKINHILEAPEPYIYFPFAQEPLVGGTLIVETAGDPLLWVPAVKQQIRTLDKTAVVRQVFTGRSVIRADLYEQRMLAALVTGMSLLGMFLAAVGLYGVVTHLVNLRSHEIGIRMALGARRKDVLMLVLFQGLKLVLAGLVAGLGMAYAATRLMSGMLFGVTPTDPVALFGGASVACTVALLACCLPARRATMVDPMVALRHE